MIDPPTISTPLATSPIVGPRSLTMRENGGSRITLTERVNFFNGDRVSTVSDTINIEPGQSFTKATSWCSAVNDQHTFRTDWSGSDAAGNKISAQGPTVTLRKQ